MSHVRGRRSTEGSRTIRKLATVARDAQHAKFRGHRVHNGLPESVRGVGLSTEPGRGSFPWVSVRVIPLGHPAEGGAPLLKKNPAPSVLSGARVLNCSYLYIGKSVGKIKIR